jgi:hypothetical protein
MSWAAYCIARAEECAAMADETEDPARLREWVLMAADWAAAAAANDNPPPAQLTP